MGGVGLDVVLQLCVLNVLTICAVALAISRGGGDES
jgi:hypothetical protein